MHCPDHYNRLEIEELESGRRLTQRAGDSPDVFHCRLSLSPMAAGSCRESRLDYRTGLLLPFGANALSLYGHPKLIDPTSGSVLAECFFDGVEGDGVAELVEGLDGTVRGTAGVACLTLATGWGSCVGLGHSAAGMVRSLHQRRKTLI